MPLHERPQIVVLNKIDVPEARELAEFIRPEFEEMGFKVFEISTASHEGLKSLILRWQSSWRRTAWLVPAAEKEAGAWLLSSVVRPKGLPR